MRLLLIVFALFASWLATNTANAQCLNGRCVRPSAPLYLPAQVISQASGIDPATVDFGRSESEPGVLILHSGSAYLGKFDLNTGYWTNTKGESRSVWELAGYKIGPTGKIGHPSGDYGAVVAKEKCAGTDCDCESCEGPSCKCKPTSYGAAPANNRDTGPAQVNLSGGVDYARLRGDRDRYTTSDGKEVTRTQGLASLEAAGEIPNDSQLVRITIIGPEIARKTVLDDLDKRPEFASLKGRVVLASYPADHWRIRDGGFKIASNSADAMIYVQRPDGTVLWRQEGYSGGPSKLASALRDKVPGYDPGKDPNPENQPLVKPVEPGKKPSALAWFIAGAVLLGGIWYVKKKGA